MQHSNYYYKSIFIKEINNLRNYNKISKWNINKIPKINNEPNLIKFNNNKYNFTKKLFPFNKDLCNSKLINPEYHKLDQSVIIRQISVCLLNEFNYQLNINGAGIDTYLSNKYVYPYKLSMVEFDISYNISDIQKNYNKFLKTFYYLELSNALLEWNLFLITPKYMIINNKNITISHLENYYNYLQIYKNDLLRDESKFDFNNIFLL
jgi:hypothetical protein